MHRLSHIIIRNFRACENVSLPLGSYTPLVGKNNAGKTTILEAIKWVLKPAAVTENDFRDRDQPIEVIACIEGITPELIARIPDARHRRAIEPYCRNGKMWIRATATGTRAADKSSEVWDVDNVQGDGPPDAWRAYPTGLSQGVSVLLPEPIYVEAMEDLGEDLGKAKNGTTIKYLLDEIMAPVIAAHDDLTTALETIKNRLTKTGANRSPHLEEFDQNASAALDAFFPGLSLDLDLQLVELKEFFKAGDLNVTDLASGDRRKFDQMGTGAQRSIQMALIRYLAETRDPDPDQPSRRLLLIDEPELYLHPQGVRRLRQSLSELSSAGFQVIVSTHSPLMLSRENAPDTVIVRKTADAGASANAPLRQAVLTALASAPSQTRTLFALGNVAEIYFADLVILCEGKTDERLLPLAYEKIYGKEPALDHISFVSVGACSDIPKALPVLSAMGIKACAVADLDFAFVDARKCTPRLLDRDGADMEAARQLFERLRQNNEFAIGGNGLPVNDKRTGSLAADAWALLAADDDGRDIAQTCHMQLLQSSIWVWPVGAIEHVTGHTGKGEDAIAEQEELITNMEVAEFDERMPLFRQCFEWARAL